MRWLVLLAAAALSACATPPLPMDPPGSKLKNGVNSSGGALIAEQAAFDVLHYDLAIAVDPEGQSIRGTLTMTAKALAPLGHAVLDLDDRLVVSKAEEDGRALEFRQRGGMVAVTLGRWRAAGDRFKVAVTYGGKPRVAPRPPWDGGFTWAKTADGRPWIATSCQMEGADLWWPCKDHPSDKPEGVDLRISVPETLVCASNGRLVEDRKNGDGTRTFHWRVTTPISNYCIALNIAPYEVVQEEYTSVAGEPLPVRFWVLPENAEKGRKALPAFVKDLRVFEEICGPYPFRGDKYGVAETPHLGMEHQTIIAYGNRFRGDPDGYDWLHNHELSHEWWGNLVTCRDWKDMWIHEGIGTYMQALFLERTRGVDAYRKTIAGYRRGSQNKSPVAPREVKDSREIYRNGDIYPKGALVMHALRWLLGDETFFKALRRMAYPDPALERRVDGSAVRLSDSDEIRAIAERVSGRQLGWFFEVYLHQPFLPELVTARDGAGLVLTWKVPDGLPFPMPVPVKLGAEIKRIEMKDGSARIAVGDAPFELDPEGWLVRK